MQIHELNTFSGKPGDTDYMAIDSGFDTMKISAPNLLKTKVNTPLNEDNTPNNGTEGQLLRTKGDGSTEWSDVGLPTDAQTAQAISDWLDAHPEATTTVQDGSLTEAKFSAALKAATIKEYITPEMYGAAGDNSTDDYAALLTAFGEAYNNNKTIILANIYYCSQPLVITDVPNIEMFGRINFNNCDGLTLGSSGKYIENKTLRISVTNKADDYSSNLIGCKIINMVNCQVYIDRIRGFNTALDLYGNGGALSYNTFFLNEVRGGLYGINCEKVSPGYVTENLFIGGRIDTTRSSESNSAAVTFIGSNNVMLKPSVESAQVCFKFIGAQNNTIIACRSEGATALADFDSASRNNRISVGYGTRSMTNGSNILNLIEAARIDYVPSVLLNPYINTVWDSGSLLQRVNIGSSTTSFEAPLQWINTYSSSTPQSTSPAVQTLAVGNKLKIDGGGIGVMVDCSTAKDFAVLQGGSQMGVAMVKLYDANGDLMDMTNISVSPYSQYENGFGHCLLLQNVEASYIRIPEEAKSAFIGVCRTGSSTAPILFKLCIKSSGMSAPIY